MQAAMAEQQVRLRRNGSQPSVSGRVLHKLIEAGVEDGVRNRDGGGGDDTAVLQRFLGADRGSVVLSIDGVLSDRDAHRASEDSEVFVPVDMAEDIELVLPGCVACCCSWIDTGSCD